MEEVADRVWRLGTRYVNFYLMADGEALTLVDSGFPSYWQELEPALQSLGRKPSDIEALLLTHAHGDHCGGAARVQSLSGATVYVHGGDAALARGEEKQSTALFRRAWRPFLLTYVIHAVTNGAARLQPVGDVRIFTGGEVLDVPGSPKVIHTPGHSHGSCAFLLEGRGVLFSGDVISRLDALSGRHEPRLPPHRFNADDDQAIASLASLRQVNAEVMLPGHGDPFIGGVGPAIEAALQEGIA